MKTLSKITMLAAAALLATSSTCVALTATTLPANAGPKTFTLYHGGSTVAFKNAHAVRARLRLAYLPRGYKVITEANDFNMSIHNPEFNAPSPNIGNLGFQAVYSTAQTVPKSIRGDLTPFASYSNGRVTGYYVREGVAGSSDSSTDILVVIRISNGYAELGYSDRGDPIPTAVNSEVLAIAQGITGSTVSASAHWPSPSPI